MENTNEEKLDDYISWFIDDLNESIVFPIGAIIYSAESLRKMAELLKNKGVVPLRFSTDEHPDLTIEKLLNFFENGKTVALFIGNEIPRKLLSQLEEIKNGKMNVLLAGKEEASVLNPIPDGAKLLLLVDRKNFENLGIEKLALSVCRME